MRWTALLSSLLLLAAAACDRSANSPPTPDAKPSQGAAAAKPGINPELLQLIRSSTLGASAGSAEVPVEVRFDLRDAPLSGQPFTLPILVLPADAIPSVKIEVSGAEGLTVLEPTTPVALDKLAAGTVRHLELKATADGTGLKIVNVTVTAEIPGGAQSRTFSYPLLVRAPAAPGS
jgi:hypothetical protein